MKIRDAKQMYAAHRAALWEKRQTLSKLLKEQERGNPVTASFDRVELSRELSQTDAQYEAVDQALQGITAAESAARQVEDNRQRRETMAKAADEMVKIMEVYRRVASGARVPPEDEKKLMEYDFKLYMAAKQAALLAERNDEEYDSLWDEEERPGERRDSGEVAGDTEISVPAPETVSASVESAPEESVE